MASNRSAQGFDGCAELELRVEELSNALSLQEQTITELTDILERQGEVIGGLGLLLRALADVSLSHEQRVMLEGHLKMTTGGELDFVRSSMVEALLS